MICLTFDTDYMKEEWMQEFLMKFPIPGKATFFLDQPYSIDFGDHELAPHPYLQNSVNWFEDLKEMEKKLNITPKGLRPHSCVCSQQFFVEIFKDIYQYTSVTTPFLEKGLRAYKLPWGGWELPIYYMDNMDICMSLNWKEIDHTPFSKKNLEVAMNNDGLYLFDFHPIHIALNTRCYGDYTTVRDSILNENISPFELSCEGYGVRNFFMDLCKTLNNNRLRSVSCADVIDDAENVKKRELV